MRTIGNLKLEKQMSTFDEAGNHCAAMDPNMGTVDGGLAWLVFFVFWGCVFCFFFFWEGGVCRELVSIGVSGGDGLIHEGYLFILLIRTLLY